MDFHGKTVVVTGAGKPIGEAVCRAFSKCGADVAVCDASLEAAECLAKELGGSAKAYKVDLSDFDSLEGEAGKIKNDFGKIDVLVNADFDELPDEERKDLHEMDYDMMVKMIDAGTKGMFRFSHYCSKDMAERKSGAIVNITSVKGITPVEGQTPVVAIAGAVVGMTKMWGVEMHDYNIRTNCIAAGILGEQKPYEEQDEIMKIKLAHNGIMRPAKAEEIANAALFLASDYASYITGAILPVDGGVSAGYVRSF